MRRTLSRLSRVALTAASLAMLAACGNSQTDGGVHSAAAPVIEQRTQVKLICPAELDAPSGTTPAVPDGAVINGNDAGMKWLGDLLAWARGLSDRLEDARIACP